MAVETIEFKEPKARFEQVVFDEGFFGDLATNLRQLETELNKDSDLVGRLKIDKLQEEFPILGKPLMVKALYSEELDEETMITSHIYRGRAVDFIFDDSIKEWHDHFNEQGLERVIISDGSKVAYILLANMEDFENDWQGIDGMLAVPISALEKVEVLSD